MAKMRDSIGDRIFNSINIILVTIFMLIVAYPLIYIISCSISDPNLVGNGQVLLIPKGLNIDGYIRVFQDKNIMIGYGNSIYYTIIGTMINLVCTLPAGYALSKKKLPFRGLILIFIFIPMYFSGGLIPLYLLVRNMNLLNKRLVLLIIGSVSVYNLIICRTFFQSVSSEIEDAAKIDGCSTTRLFIMIVLPLSQALIGVMVLYYGVGHWNSYFSAMIFIIDNSKKPLQLFLRQILITEQMSSAMRKNMSGDQMFEMEQLKHLLKYSVIIVSSLPVLIVYPFLQKYFDKGVMIGSLKG